MNVFLTWYTAFIGIHYLPFVIVALVTFVLRLVLHKTSRAERFVFIAFFGLLAVEAFQLIATHCHYKYGHPDFSVTWQRYFGVLSPLIWLWTAVGIVQLWCAITKGWGALLMRLAIVVTLGGLFTRGVGYLWKEYDRGAGRDALVAGEAIAPIIRADYHGPAKYENFPYRLNDYYTSRRPVVVSFWGCAAWAVRGQSQGVSPGYPFQEDYLFARVDSRFTRGGLGEALEHSPDHCFVSEVKGSVYRWRLYRRRTSREASSITTSGNR